MNAVRGWKVGLAALLTALPLLVGAARAEVKPAVEPLISPDEMLSIDQIRPGMQGYGKSVFQGTKIERFNVTVLGVLRKMDYDGDMILIRINDGPPVTSGAGVSAGMSGSPIYVDGKLIGALAFAWPFAKDPVAGVTPIAQMLNVYQPGSAPRPQAVAQGDLALRDGPLQLDGKQFARARVVPDRGLAPAAVTGGMMYLTPVATPIMCSGMGRTGIDALQKTLHRYSAMVMQGPGAPDLPPSERPKIEPGSAVGVQLLGGDVDSTAIGTVTYVKGDHVIAFGHPMFGLGTIDMPMTTAYIHGVISTQEVSFKMGSSIDAVGHITQDRNWSIGGRMGQPAKSVEAQFTITDSDRGVHRDYHVRAAVQRDVTPALIYGSLLNAVNSVSPPASGTTRGSIEIWPHGMQPIKKENIFSQSEKPSPIEQLFGDPFANMPLAELLQIMSTLEVNSFGSVPIDKIRVTVDVSEKRQTASIERAYADRKRVRPGETVKLGVVIQPADGPKQTEEFEVKIPGNIPAGKLQIGVAGGSSTERVRQMMMIVKPQAKSLAQLLQQFAERERNNDLTVEIAQPVAGVAVSGYEFPNLPNVVVEVLTGATASGVRMTRSHLRQTRTMPWVLSGAALLSLDVEADEKDKAGVLPMMLPTSGLGGMGSLLDLFKMSAGGDNSLLGGLDDGQASSGDDEASAGLRSLLRLATRAAKGGHGSGANLPDDAKMPSFEELQKILSGDATGTESASGAEGGEATVAKTGVARAPGVWKMGNAAELQAGKLEGALISSRGELALAPQAKTLLTSPDRFFWAQTADRAGNVYVGGWLNGEITRINPQGESKTLFNTAPEVAVTALTSDESGTLYAASEPSGSVYRIGADGQATVICKLTGQRVWTLHKSGADLYAGTGSDGRLYRITGDGKAEVVFTAPDRHILALADDGKGSLYLGTYPRGKVFRVREGKVTPVYEVPSLTITALAADGRGNVYLGTSPRATVIKVDAAGTATTLYQSREKHVLSLLLEGDGSVVAGTGAPARVYRIAPDKTVSTLWDPKAADVLSLSRDGSGNLYATTAGPTQIVELTAKPAASGSYTSPVLNAKALSRWGAVRWVGPAQGVEIQTRSGNTSYPDGTWSEWSAPYRKAAGENVTSPAGQYLQYRVVLRGSQAEPAPVVRNLELFYRTRNRAPEVKVQTPATGEVLSGTRAIKWSAKDPDGDRLTYDIYFAKEGSDQWTKIGTRTGKTQGENGPEKGADELGIGGEASVGAAGLFDLSSAAPAHRPTHAPVAVSTLRGARPAARAAKSQPAPGRTGTAKGAAAGAPVSKPEAAEKSLDPTVGDEEVMEGTGSINWNTKKAPDGRYRIKIVTTDVLTSPDEPATVEVLSEPVQVVNTPPVFQLAKAQREGPAPPAAIPVTDAGTYVSSAEYRVDDGEWIGAAAADGIFDSSEEAIRIDLNRLKAGKHVLEVRARDAAGNEAAVKVPYVLAAAPASVAVPKAGK